MQAHEIPRADPAPNVVSLKEVCKDYYRGKLPVPVLRNLSLDIAQGEFVSVTGASGSGKSTLLNLIGGLDRPDVGSIHVGGERIDRLSASALAAWRGTHVGFVFQFYNLLPALTAAQNIEIPLMLKRLSKAERAQRVAAAIEVVGLPDRASHRPTELSGGQQQRVAIARALVANPSLLLCDEPTGDLDRDARDEVLALLRTLNRDYGKTVVLVTHDSYAAKFADRDIQFEKIRLGPRLIA